MPFEIPADVNLADDLDVSHDPETAKDPALPLPLAGVFAVRIKKMDLKTVYQSNPPEVVYIDGKYPVLRLSQLEIVKPEDMEGRNVSLQFDEFSTKPYEETDFNAGGAKYWTNNLQKMVRAHDASLAFRGLDEGLRLVQRIVNDNGIFFVQLDYIAEDRKWIGETVKSLDAQVQQGVMTEEDARKARNEARYKKGRREGVNKFVVKETGMVDPSWEGPSGEIFEARTFLKKFIPTTQIDSFKLGRAKALRPKAA